MAAEIDIHEWFAMRDSEWAQREQRRFYDGSYREVIWVHEGWWWDMALRQQSPLSFHFAHVSKEDPSQIAFTENPSKGERDVQQRMKPGRYLKRYLGHVLSDDAIKEWAGKWAERNEVPELLFATTADEIENVYLHGPESCMSHDPSDYDSPFHPVRVYAAGDLAVAYIQRKAKDPDDEDHFRITARALCWPERKVYSRLYGDEYRLRSALEAAGYTPGKLNGARLQKHETGNGVVLPYIDNHSTVKDCGSYLRIGDGDIDCQPTCGVAYVGDPCGECGETYSEDELSYYECVESALCESCVERVISYCEECEDNVVRDDINYIDDRFICDHCRDTHYIICSYGNCENYMREGNVHAEDADGDALCERCTDRYFTFCEPCEKYHPDADVNDNGHCESCAATHQENESDDEGTEDAA